VTDAGARARTPWLLLAGVAVAVVLVDQLTKWWAVEQLGDRQIQLVGSLQLNLVRNLGSAFSIGGGSWWGGAVSLAGLVIIVGLLWFARLTTSRLAVVALGLVVGGAIGNLIDRAARSERGFMGGGVIDFVDLQWWPVFNVADAAVVVGVVILLVVTLIGERSEQSATGGAQRA
jgi:signal peptidase II